MEHKCSALVDRSLFPATTAYAVCSFLFSPLFHVLFSYFISTSGNELVSRLLREENRNLYEFVISTKIIAATFVLFFLFFCFVRVVIVKCTLSYNELKRE